MFINALNWWQWAILATVPPAIVALYFLKLRRQPLEVPSTWLWRRALDDLRVNSLWQRLRNSLLLWLQLLLIALAMLACLRPGLQGTRLRDHRFIFLIDTSASMQATDVAPSRLEEAKRQARAIIDRMSAGDVAMLVSFAERARVEQTFTDDKRLLQRKLAALQPTAAGSDLSEALQVAAGLANPQRTATDYGDIAVADPLPATLYIMSDGGFDQEPNFSMENLKPVYVRIGTETPRNIAITTFAATRVPDRPGEVQFFGQLHNFSDAPVAMDTDLWASTSDAEPIESFRLQVEPGETRAIDVSIPEVQPGSFRWELQVDDDLAVDNQAWCVVNPLRRATVLVVTPGNDYLRLATATDQIKRFADIVFMTPEQLTAPEYEEKIAEGNIDLVIFDRSAPVQNPRANTIYFATVPPGDRWQRSERYENPQIVDVDGAHPLMRFLEFGNLLIAEARPLQPPPGANILIDSDGGPLIAIAPRDGWEDVVLGFELIGVQDGRTYANTDWVTRVSFPLFISNALEYLGRATHLQETPTLRPGTPISLRSPTSHDQVDVRLPDGSSQSLSPNAQGTFQFSQTQQLGTYSALDSPAAEPFQYFAVSAMNPRESDIGPRATIKTRYEQIEAQTTPERVRQELWKPVILVAILVLLLEWIIYHRRVFI